MMMMMMMMLLLDSKYEFVLVRGGRERKKKFSNMGNPKTKTKHAEFHLPTDPDSRLAAWR